MITVDGNVGDRNNLSLWQNGDNLINAVADANKNTVVVIHSVGPVLMPWIDHPNIKAVVWPDLPGQESGNSLADVLTGKVNPSGRLPYTIAKMASDYNVKIDPSAEVVYKEKLLMGYKWFDAQNITPQFPFGHGLSYTNFTYSDLNGSLDDTEVVQAYLNFPESIKESPKVLVKKGKKTAIRFILELTEV
ncbi:hypothetical protein G6F66_008014 [Rhizopus arrhizus]|nr:hypothetical protein G6F66_008014 [Rhizopus arrhizus]